MSNARRIASIAAVAATLSVSGAIPSRAAPAASPAAMGSPRDGAACRASEGDLAAALGFAMHLCPDVPVAASSSAPSVDSPAVDATADSTSCLPTTFDRCEAWVSTPYDGAVKGIDRVGNMMDSDNSMAITPDGTTLFTAGSTDRVGPRYDQGPIATIAVDATTGSRLWATRHDGPDEHPFGSVQSVVASNSAVFVTGYTFGGDNDLGIGMALAYDARTGAPRWEADYPGVALDSAISPDGSLLFVVGEQHVVDAEGAEQVLATTVAYDTATGEPVWTRSLSDPAAMPLVGWRVATAPGTVTVMAGRIDDGYTVGVVVATYADSGSGAGGTISKITIPVVHGNIPGGLVLNADGSRAFIVQDQMGSTESAYTAAFDTVSGTMIWTAAYAGDDVVSSAIPWFFHPIDVSPSGDTVYVATLVDSYIYGEGIAAVAYRARDGQKLWSHTQPVGTSRCVASCGPLLSVNPKTGQVVVAGAGYLGVRQQATTWSYAPDGTLQWMRRAATLPSGASVQVDRATESAWTSIVHGPDGRRVYVGGSAWAIFNDPDSSEDVVVSAFDSAMS
ncbi:MAG: PQQ-binding-like beta-propeller repeat protein [Actinomycetota bacterium]